MQKKTSSSLSLFWGKKQASKEKVAEIREVRLLGYAATVSPLLILLFLQYRLGIEEASVVVKVRKIGHRCVVNIGALHLALSL